MLRVGLVGIGFMGWIHYLAYQKVKGVKLAAIATRDSKKLAGDWRGIQGNFGPPAGQVDLAKVAKYDSLEKLLADDSIDVVDLCLPPHLHVSATLQALKAGKHVFVEKPMALTAAECQKMVAAAQKANRQIYVGHVLPLLPEYATARKLIQSGKYGKLIGGHFRRVISDPLWIKDFYNPQTVGGPLIDLHVHDAHFIRLLFGMPTSVTSQGRMRGEVAEYCSTQFQFADKSLAVSSTSGVINQQGRPFTHGFEIHLEKATLAFEFSVMADGKNLATPLHILDSKGGVIYPAMPAGDPMLTAFELEIQEVARCLKANAPSAVLGGDLARDAIILCHKQQQSLASGKTVKV